MTTFSEFALNPTLQAAVAGLGFTIPTPIQEQAIPPALSGRDILGIAQTGTGKTAAFLLPLLQHLDEDKISAKPKQIRALVLTPTRELAMQIWENLRDLTGKTNLRHTVIFGGVGQKNQEDNLRRGLDVVIATPGRLIDLMDQGLVDLSITGHFVLDEADRMLDMGFIHPVKQLAEKLPAQHQTMLFSATMPDEITKLTRQLLRNPVRVEVTPVASTVERIEQGVIYTPQSEKRFVLQALLTRQGLQRTIVFTRTKHGANRVVTQLEKADVKSAAIHGNKSQAARQAALNDFKKGKINVLIATDIAARGIDISDISHVINYDVPEEAESYVHRIGRTARAGKSGIAYTLCANDEKNDFRQIERLIRQTVPAVPVPEGVAELVANHVPEPKEAPFRDPRAAGPRGRGAPGGGQGRNRSGGRTGQDNRSANPSEKRAEGSNENRVDAATPRQPGYSSRAGKPGGGKGSSAGRSFGGAGKRRSSQP